MLTCRMCNDRLKFIVDILDNSFYDAITAAILSSFFMLTSLSPVLGQILKLLHIDQNIDFCSDILSGQHKEIMNTKKYVFVFKIVSFLVNYHELNLNITYQMKSFVWSMNTSWMEWVLVAYISYLLALLLRWFLFVIHD